MKDKNKTKEQLINESIQSDISEVKQAEMNVKESEERYRTLFEKNPYGIQGIDTSGTILYANKAHHDMYGYKEGSLIGQSITDFLVPGPQRDGLPGYLAMLVKDQPPPTNYYQKVVTKQGLQKDVEVAWNYLHDTKGDVKGFISVLTDITERKLMEEALRESEEKYHAFFEQAADSIVLIDAETGALVEFNNMACENLGYNREEFQKLKLPDFEVIESAEDVAEHIKKVIKEGADVFETKHRRKDGEIRDILASTRAISTGGKKFIQGIWKDITERKQTEEALRKTRDELEERVKERTTELKETNTALKVLLKQLENDKKGFEKNILSNIKHLILPHLAKLKKRRSMTKEIAYLNVLESNLKEIVSPFSQRLSSKYLSLTPQEIKVADFIKDGIHDKDMAEILNISVETVKSHRQNIRKKLGIYSKRTNLRIQLLSLTK